MYTYRLIPTSRQPHTFSEKNAVKYKNILINQGKSIKKTIDKYEGYFGKFV
jgi:hypothetical protein